MMPLRSVRQQVFACAGLHKRWFDVMTVVANKENGQALREKNSLRPGGDHIGFPTH